MEKFCEAHPYIAAAIAAPFLYLLLVLVMSL